MDQADFTPTNDRIEEIVEEIWPVIDQSTAQLQQRVRDLEILAGQHAKEAIQFKSKRDNERIKSGVAHADFMAMHEAHEEAGCRLQDATNALEEARRQLNDTTDAYDAITIHVANEISEASKLRVERDEALAGCVSATEMLKAEYEALEQACNEDDARDRGSMWVSYYRKFQKFLAAAIDANPVGAALMQELAQSRKDLEDYATAARVIALHLEGFLDIELPYPEMIAEASRRAAKELAALREKQAWRPIDSAPLDGTPVIIGHPAWVAESFWDSEAGYWQDQAADGGSYYPTHWMPLPAAPGAAGGGL